MAKQSHSRKAFAAHCITGANLNLKKKQSRLIWTSTPMEDLQGNENISSCGLGGYLDEKGKFLLIAFYSLLLLVISTN